MDLSLTEKTAVVTGAGAGIGLAVVRCLLAEGARVTAGSRKVTPELEQLARDHPLKTLAVDLSTPDGPAQLIEVAGPHVDILVNNVGIAPPRLDGFLQVT